MALDELLVDSSPPGEISSTGYRAKVDFVSRKAGAIHSSWNMSVFWASVLKTGISNRSVSIRCSNGYLADSRSARSWLATAFIG